MVTGERLKALREQKNLSQGDVENRSGLQRVYISRVENGHTIPSLRTLEKLARALEIPLYQLFYDVAKAPAPLPAPQTPNHGWGSTRREARSLNNFRRLLGRMNESDRTLLLFMAQKLARRHRSAEE